VRVLKTFGTSSYTYASELRRELSIRSREYAKRLNLPYRQSYGGAPVICYLPSEDGCAHGNFLPETYRAILQNDGWRQRLEKPHSQARGSLPREDRRWRELDSCNSSDALLMNIFCFPETLRNFRVFGLLGLETGAVPQFGLKARVPLANGRLDRTEVDMRFGELLVESKITESDFQTAEAAVLETYRDFEEVFDRRALPRQAGEYLSYQLIRNVLAADQNHSSFCVMSDARRPDLCEAWYAVMRCVRMLDLRLRCKILTWQELAEALPEKLQVFLREKYGIMGDSETMLPDLCVAASH